MKRAPLFVLLLAAFLIFSGFVFWDQFPFFLSATQPAAVVHSDSATSTLPTIPEAQPFLFQYLEVVDGCGPYYQGTCVNMRSGPGIEYGVVERLRTGMVLKIAGTVQGTDGKQWYEIAQDSSIRYPERISSKWYVQADAVTEFNDDGDHRIKKGDAFTTTKRIVVDLSQEVLYAYNGDILYMQEPISTGLDFTPTPRGTFTVYAMTPSRYMQGPLPGVSAQAYDLPGVPWNLYFTQDGAVIHGAYWHDHFGQSWSHGCVNLSPKNAKRLYEWAELGITVTVVN
ncbi:MAG: L,D-transpeptidase family protein [Patescibacteria group bacterium]